MNYLKKCVLSLSFILIVSCLQISVNANDVPDSINAIRNYGEDAKGKIDEATRKMVIDSYGKLPLSFIENRGQVDARAGYYAKLSNQSIYFTKEGIVFDFTKREESSKGEINSGKPDKQIGERMVFSLNFENSCKDVKLSAVDKLEGKVNYFTGDKKNWKVDIPTYKEVVYTDVYKGIDLRVYGTGKALEYDFVVNPGADPNDIFLSYKGINGLTTNEEGELVIDTPFGDLKESKPYIYQEIDGKRAVVEGRFVINKGELSNAEKTKSVEANNSNGKQVFYAFNVGSYNRDYALIIDPVLLYSTYLGGSDREIGRGIAVDSSGNAYVTGNTHSLDFPTINAFQNSKGGGVFGTDAFVAKLNPSGNVLIYSTYLGGSDNTDAGRGIAVDSSGNAYVTGVTFSPDFPTVNAFQDTLAGDADAFVTKLNPFGNGLVYSTFLGGSEGESGSGIAVDSSGNAYVTGRTFGSEDFPTVNAFQDTLAGTSDAFVTKLNASGNGLVFFYLLGWW